MSGKPVSAESSARYEPPKIDGVELVNPDKLPGEFRKFKKDVLFWIDHIAYYSREAMEEKPAARKALPRVLALTPQAIFVCDTRGVMDRATKVEIVTELVYDLVAIKKMFGSATNSRVLFRIPDEYDIVVEFEGDDGGKKAAKFCDVFSKVAGAKNSGRNTPVRKLEGADKVDEIYAGKAPDNYISPQQIMALNQLRRDFDQRVQACGEEYYSIEKNLKERRETVAAKKAEHMGLEKSVGSDIATLQKELEQARARANDAQRKLTAVDVELAKVASDADSAKKQLMEERANFEVLVKARVAAGDSQEVQEQIELMNTLKRANARELEKLNNNLAKAKTKFERPSYDAAPASLGSRAKELEDKIRVGVDRWERDTSADIKMHQKLEAEAEELAKLAAQLRDVIAKKRKAIDAKRPKPVAAPVDLLGDSSLLGGPVAAPAAGAGGAISFDDDLLGGGSAAPAAAGSVVLLDDDLLGGGPAPVALAADDSLLGGPVAAPAGDAGGDLL